jgi:hypothetical protein
MLTAYWYRTAIAAFVGLKCAVCVGVSTGMQKANSIMNRLRKLCRCTDERYTILSRWHQHVLYLRLRQRAQGRKNDENFDRESFFFSTSSPMFLYIFEATTKISKSTGTPSTS